MEKDNFFQELKGLCIIAVILIHLPIGNEADETFNYWLSFRSIINFPVAMFIFLSGYFDKRVQKKGLGFNNPDGNYIINRLKRLIPPYLFWSTIYLVFSYSLGRELSLTNVLISYMSGNAYGHLYYLIALIQLTILSPVIIKMIKTNNKLWLYFSVSITFLWILFIYTYSFYYEKTLPLYTTLFPAWFFFYYFGMYKRFESENQTNIKTSSIIKLLMFLFFAIILSLFESNIIYNYTKMASLASSQVKFSSFIFVYLLIKFVIKIKEQNLVKTSLSKIGDYSFGIYLIHYIFLIPTSSLIEHLNLPEYLFIIEQVSILVIVLGICYSLIYIANKFLSLKIIHYLGLK